MLYAFFAFASSSFYALKIIFLTGEKCCELRVNHTPLMQKHAFLSDSKIASQATYVKIKRLRMKGIVEGEIWVNKYTHIASVDSIFTLDTFLTKLQFNQSEQ